MTPCITCGRPEVLVRNRPPLKSCDAGMVMVEDEVCAAGHKQRRTTFAGLGMAEVVQPINTWRQRWIARRKRAIQHCGACGKKNMVSVHLEKGLFYCFSCGDSGRVGS